MTARAMRRRMPAGERWRFHIGSEGTDRWVWWITDPDGTERARSRGAFAKVQNAHTDLCGAIGSNPDLADARASWEAVRGDVQPLRSI